MRKLSRGIESNSLQARECCDSQPRTRTMTSMAGASSLDLASEASHWKRRRARSQSPATSRALRRPTVSRARMSGLEEQRKEGIDARGWERKRRRKESSLGERKERRGSLERAVKGSSMGGSRGWRRSGTAEVEEDDEVPLCWVRRERRESRGREGDEGGGGGGREDPNFRCWGA